MVAAKTTSDLVEEVREQCLLPTIDGRLGSTETLANLAICRFASNALRTHVAELMIGTRSQRWLSTATDTSIVSGTYLYAIPERALGAGVADVLIVDSAGEEFSAPEIAFSEAWRWRSAHGGWNSPFAYCWRDDDIELLPHPTQSAYSLRVIYPRGLLRLVRTSDCAVISSKTATTITTTATVPSAWASSETIDIVSHRPNGKVLAIDQAGTSIATTNVTILAGVPSDAAAGNFVCLDGETCVPPVPDVMWPVLVAATGLELMLAGIGNESEIAAAAARTKAAKDAARSMLAPRSRGASKKIVAHGSPLRRSS